MQHLNSPNITDSYFLLTCRPTCERPARLSLHQTVRKQKAKQRTKSQADALVKAITQSRILLSRLSCRSGCAHLVVAERKAVGRTIAAVAAAGLQRQVRCDVQHQPVAAVQQSSWLILVKSCRADTLIRSACAGHTQVQLSLIVAWTSQQQARWAPVCRSVLCAQLYNEAELLAASRVIWIH